MLCGLSNTDKILLSSSESILEKFMIEHKDKIVCIFTDYSIVLRSDALVVALKSEQQLRRLRKRFESHNVRFIEIVDFEDLMGWRDEAE